MTASAVVLVLLAGALAYGSLPRSMDPEITPRVARVTALFPGASPQRVEELVTDKLEEAIQEIPELDFVASESRTSLAIVTVSIKEEYTAMRPIWDDLRRKVAAVSDLPEEVIGPFVNDEFGDIFGTIITITGDGFSYAEIKDIADEVRDQLLRIEEVAKVNIHGAQDERVFVEFKNEKLARLGLSPVQLQQILATRNIVISGGSVTTGLERLALEPSGNFETIDDLKNTIVRIPGDTRVLRLQDLADIERGYLDPPESKTLSSLAAEVVDRERVHHAVEVPVPTLALAISLRKGGNIVELGKRVDDLYVQLPDFYPHGVEFEIAAFQSADVERRVSAFVGNVLQAIGIVVVVMLITLGPRVGLLVATLVPATILASLMFMSIFGIWLDQISLAALIISLGLLVDNAIVMTESIKVRIDQGAEPFEAAVASARELRVPLLTSSLTTCAAFLPIYLAESAVGEYTNPLFKVVSIALLTSWLFALTMTPLLCVKFLPRPGAPPGRLGRLFGRWSRKEKKAEQPFTSPIYRLYRAILIATLRRRAVTLIVVTAVFGTAMAGMAFVPQLFFPVTEEPRFTATVKLPVGTPIERTEEVTAEIQEFLHHDLRSRPDRKAGLTSWAVFVGEGAPRFQFQYVPDPPSPEYSLFLMNTDYWTSVPLMMSNFEDWVFDRYPDVEVKVKPISSGPPIVNPIEIRISGPETDQVFAIVDQVKAKLRELDGPKVIRDDWGNRAKKLVVAVDQPRAYRAGLTSRDIAFSLQTIFDGFPTTQYREGDKIVPVTLRSVSADRQDLGKIETLNIYSQTSGQNVPLKQVANVEVEWEPARILRRDRYRTVTVMSDLETGVTAREITDQMIPWLEEQSKSWGLGYRFEIGGENEIADKGNQSIADKLPIALFIILMLLIYQFNSIRKTLIILIAIPLALIGVVVGLHVGRSYFGFMTLLGIISLAGIVINNAIVLIERIKVELDANRPHPAAIVEAAQTRMRPIFLTTATTVAGLTPLYLSGGRMWEPMALTIMFGLIFSTLLTLLVVPVVYSALFRVSFKGYRYGTE